MSNDDMVSNSLEHSLKHNDAILEVRPTAYDNMKALYGLEQITLTKPEFMAYMKAFLPKVKALLTKNDKSERVPEFMKGATEAVKFVVG